MDSLTQIRQRREQIADLLERLPKDDICIIEDVTMIRKGLQIWDAVLALQISQATKEAKKCT